MSANRGSKDKRPRTAGPGFRRWSSWGASTPAGQGAPREAERSSQSSAAQELIYIIKQFAHCVL